MTNIMTSQAHVALLQVVEASAAAGKLVTRSNANFNESEAEVEPLQGFVVAIPTMNAIHGQDSWQGEHVSNEYADHAAWDVREIVTMLKRFFAASGAISLPALAEYEWRLDKVQRYRASTGICDMLQCFVTCCNACDLLQCLGIHQPDVLLLQHQWVWCICRRARA